MILQMAAQLQNERIRELEREKEDLQDQLENARKSPRYLDNTGGSLLPGGIEIPVSHSKLKPVVRSPSNGSHGSPPLVDAKVGLSEEDPYYTYAKMLQMGVQRAAVDLKLISKGLDPSELTLRLDPSSKEEMDEVEDSEEDQEVDKKNTELDGVLLKDHPDYQPFLAMLDRGVPLPAVKHEVAKKGLNPDVMDLDKNRPIPPGFLLDDSDDEVERILIKDDPRYVPYLRMLKMGIPKGAVQHKMVQKGLHPEILDMDPSEPSPLEKEWKQKTMNKHKDGMRWRKVHWDKVEDVDKSVWTRVFGFKLSPQENDDLKNLFAQKLEDEGERKKKEMEAKKEKERLAKLNVQLIDPARAQNINITLSRYANMTAADLRWMICNLQLKEEFTAEDMFKVLSIMPNDVEKETLREYKGDVNVLGAAEKHLLALISIPRYQKRVSCFLFMLKYQEVVDDVKVDATHLDSACEVMRESDKFAKLLEIVLITGNKLNYSNAPPGTLHAKGFTLSNLMKLKNVKAFSGSITLLEFILTVRCFFWDLSCVLDG